MRARWHGEGQALALRYAARFFIVARGLSPAIAQPAREPNAARGLSPDRCMARDRPSPYGMRHVFFTVARGPATHGGYHILRCYNPINPIILQILIQTIGRAEDRRRYNLSRQYA